MKRLLILLFLIVATKATTQDIEYARKMVDTLASPSFWGRGYTNDGMHKAASFLNATFKNIGLQPFTKKVFSQSYYYSVNTFPGEMSLIINDKILVAGVDFIVSPESKGIKASGEFEQIDSVQFIHKKSKLLLKLEDKLTWSVSQEEANYTIIQVLKKSLTNTPKSFSVNIENNFINKFEAQNIVGFVKGTIEPDSFLVLTAHYDHLGGMGKDTYFPGANDNASGVALLLNIAKYYAQNPQKYSIAFILFSGEEAGLLGSKHFVENPLLILNRIKFLINTDLAGTGDDGITIVNASEFVKEFELMQQINNELKLLKTINPRGKAANSDHYFFTEKGVPSFFFYTLGGIKAYHDVFDKAETLPLNEQKDLFTLITTFFSRL